MFSPEIVCSEEFLDMPASSRDLYFQLGMRADDDGFIQPKMIMKLLGSSTDDIKVLTAKRFILPFESGVVVIKHWLIHNMIRLDRYKATRFLEEKNKLFIKENKAYTDNSYNGVPLLATKWQPNGNQSAPQVRLGKVSIDKQATPTSSIKEITDFFYKSVESKTGKKPELRKKDFGILQIHLKTNTAENTKKIISWYLTQPKFREFPTLSACLSSHSVNLFNLAGNQDWQSK
jgi:hypothetical protein